MKTEKLERQTAICEKATDNDNSNRRPSMPLGGTGRGPEGSRHVLPPVLVVLERILSLEGG